MSIETRKLAGNVSVAFMAQGFALCVSLMMSFFVPKILGTEEFGYWQLFIFYTNYVSLLQFGLNDGIYLINGGKHRSRLDIPMIRAVFKTNFAFQLAVTLVIATASVCFVPDQSRAQVLLATAAYAFLFNITYFVGFLFQATNEVKRYSISQILDRLFFLIVLLGLMFCRVDTFAPYVAAFLFGRCVSFVYALVAGREFIFGSTSHKGVLSECMHDMKVGIKLTFANMASLLVLGVFRFMVDAQWDIETFGQFSLALTLVSFFLTFISQVSMVLFPALRQVRKDDLALFFQSLSGMLAVIMPVAYLLYTPIVIVLNNWIPDYSVAMSFFALLLPICVFDSRMGILGTTILKVTRKEALLLAVNVSSVVLSSALAVFGAVILHSMQSICVFAVVSVGLRAVVAEAFLTRYFNLSIASHVSFLVGEVLLAILFIVANASLPPWLAFAITIVGYLIFAVVLRKGIYQSMQIARKLFV